MPKQKNAWQDGSNNLVGTPLNELDEIADYISLDNPKAAKHLVRSIFKRIEHLESHQKVVNSLLNLKTQCIEKL